MTLLNDIQVWTSACSYDHLIPGRGVGVLLDDGFPGGAVPARRRHGARGGQRRPVLRGGRAVPRHRGRPQRLPDGAVAHPQAGVLPRRRYLPGRSERFGAGVPGAHHRRQLRSGGPRLPAAGGLSGHRVMSPTR
ncbi:nitrite reductase [NAD(P)H], small subunit [Mycobacterium avium subsp. paratuberculosis S5]|nr:nitrite reductase [NAD(P)H], small subunit [Mycobacterium avium subsp. paratuberculosis S5]